MKPLYLSLLLLMVSLIVGCKKEEPPTVPVVSTTVVVNVTESSARSGGNITSDGRSAIIIYGVCWSTSAKPTINNDSKTVYGLGTGPFTISIDGLAGGTAYWVRAYATNSIGTAYGKDITFTTLGQAPTATTNPATNIFTTVATLNGTVNANYLATTVTFEYGITTSYGSTVTASQNEVTGEGATDVSADLSDLSSNTNYHFRVKTVNDLGTAYGDDRTFTTLEGLAPNATTAPATNISENTALLNGIVNANYFSTTVTFEYGTTTGYGNTVSAYESTVEGGSATNVIADISGLATGRTYHFRVKAENSEGTVYGDDITFTTLLGVQAPIVSTNPATNISQTGATLNGTVNANGLSAKVTFEYDSNTTSYDSTIAAFQSPVAGDSITNVSADISGLTPGVTYHFRVKAENSDGTVYGDDIQFTLFTCNQVPAVKTLAATNIIGSSATLNGKVDGNDWPTTVTFWYRLGKHYGRWTFGRATVPGTVTGDTLVSASVSVAGRGSLNPHTFWVTATNVCGTVTGNVLSFTTQ